MMPAIRNGLVSKLATWLRAGDDSGRHFSTLPAVAAKTPHTALSTHADEALRSFLSFALDGERSKPATEDELSASQSMLDAASTALARLEVQAKYLPRRPSVLPKLLSAMHNDGGSMRDLAKIIGDDPTLMGNLLRVVNSAFYGIKTKVVSLDRAVTLIGFNGIRSVIATALMHPVMARGNGSFNQFADNIWEHTQLAADAAELHALHIELADGFHARLLTLVHGLAMNAVFRIVRDEARDKGIELSKSAATKLLEQWVTPIASRIAANWELPEEVRYALTASRAECELARSLFFGRLAASQLILVQRQRLREFAARAFVLAGDPRRKQVDRLWTRLVLASRAT
jgi:HD-like signal output (HDOD) protein